MRVLLMLFFAFTAPVVLFLFTVLYGGVTNDSLKKSLAASNVYTKLSTYFSEKDASVAEEFQTFSSFASKRLTADYIKSKTEGVIDDSAAWITGNSLKSPSISFNEIKSDLQYEDPALFETLQHVPTAKELDESSLSEEEKTQYLEQAKQIESFTNSDFTVNLGEHLQGFKTVYGYIKIALPILTIILLVCLIVIALTSSGLYEKLKWLGITFLISSIVGFASIFTYTFLSGAASQFSISEQPDIVALMTPILLSVFKHYAEVYTAQQFTLSTTFFAAAVLLMATAFIVRHKASHALKPLKIGKSYWTQPDKKKKK